MYRVLKFGGTSVANATNMSRVLDIVEAESRKGRVILVSSAIAGCTDALLQGDAAALADLQERHREIVRRLFTGVERRSMLERIDALFTELRKAPAEEVVTYGDILSTTILCAKLEVEGYRTQWLDSRKLVIKDNEPLTYNNIQREVEPSLADIFVAPGFICGTQDRRVSTLGRGGSDYSAALYAAAVKAESLQIWTDVPGIMTANPKQVPGARTIPRMSYASALDMASHGAKVLYAPTVAPAMAAGIDIEIRNTFAPDGKYTVIGAEPDASRWIGVASQGDRIRVVGTASGEEGLLTASEALREAGIAALEMQADGPSLDILVRPAVLESSLKALHRAFFQAAPLQEVNLLVAGEGAVARAFFQMVRQTAGTVQQRTGKVLRIVGRADSRRFGMDPGGHPELTREGDYVDAILSEATQGAVFVDLTDSETLYKRYLDLLQAGLGIVSSNRRSFAVPYTEYAAIQAAARENGVALRYETTVGAALPVLESIARGGGRAYGGRPPDGPGRQGCIKETPNPGPRGRCGPGGKTGGDRDRGARSPLPRHCGGFLPRPGSGRGRPGQGGPRGGIQRLPPPLRGLAGEGRGRLPGPYRHPGSAPCASRLLSPRDGERHRHPQHLPSLSAGYPGPRRRRPRGRQQYSE